VGRLSATFAGALERHRRAVAYLRGAEQELARITADRSHFEQSYVEQIVLADQLRHIAGRLTPGWLGIQWNELTSGTHLPMGRDVTPNQPVLVRLGEATVAGGQASFPVVVPLLGAGHLAIDADARDPRVTALFRGLLTRLLAACPPELLRVLPVDSSTVGAVFAPFQPLVEAGAIPPTATTQESFHAVLDEAEQHVRAAQAGATDLPYLLLAIASLPADGRSELTRLASLAHAGPSHRVHLLIGGYPPRLLFQEQAPRLDYTAQLMTVESHFQLRNPPGTELFGVSGLAGNVTLDPEPFAHTLRDLTQQLAISARTASTLSFTELQPERLWTESSITGLRTVVGREGRRLVELAFDDATPHWMVGGRTGSGKTVFLLDVLYGLAARYSPDELALYLLDFKEGVSFTEFTPTEVDPTWIPHARAVGIESDREYGVAVLRELVGEMNRRATALKRAGVTKLADLRQRRTDVALPRILAVIDEFHVLFNGNDHIAAEAAALLENLARKGRSYGIHLILASQTAAGIEALYTKSESIFGQFPMRIALAGATGILDPLNDAAAGLPIGTAVVNDSGGIAGRNRLVRFPDAHAEAETLRALRHRLWEARTPGSAPPAVFTGYAEQRIEDDPTYQRLSPTTQRRWALVGRTVDVTSSTARFALDTSVGRHVAVLGPSVVGADILQAAALGLARQHHPGHARFILASLVAAADQVTEETAVALRVAGHLCDTVDANGLRRTLARVARPEEVKDEESAGGAEAANTVRPAYTYLFVFGMDAASGVLSQIDTGPGLRTGLDDLRTVLKQGPGQGVHLLAWWRSLARFTEDIGGSAGREDVACLVALNVPGNELGLALGRINLEWRPRPNRALLVDRHDDRTQVIVPFVRPGHYEGVL